MKFLVDEVGMIWDKSLPVRGAWIEIGVEACVHAFIGSLPVRGAWIEIFIILLSKIFTDLSLPVRGAWIEIPAAA